MKSLILILSLLLSNLALQTQVFAGDEGRQTCDICPDMKAVGAKLQDPLLVGKARKSVVKEAVNLIDQASQHVMPKELSWRIAAIVSLAAKFKPQDDPFHSWVSFAYDLIDDNRGAFMQEIGKQPQDIQERMRGEIEIIDRELRGNGP